MNLNLATETETEGEGTGEGTEVATGNLSEVNWGLFMYCVYNQEFPPLQSM